MTDADAGAGNSALPPLHKAWLSTLAGIHDPQSEPKATCGDCVMCGGIERSHSTVTFSPTVKCCSYVPHLANFLVGRALLTPGRESVMARIAQRSGVTPLGLGLSHADIARIVGSQSHFGRSAAVVCPHFLEQTQGCAIWQTRNAVCSTWFCKHERGAVSQAFWHAVRDLLIAAEERIAHRCLTQGGLPDAQVEAVLGYRAGIRQTIARANTGAALQDTTPEDEAAGWYERMWGDWAGREQDWFLANAEVMAAMSDAELRSSLADAPELVQTVRDRARDLRTRQLPEHVTFSPGVGSHATPEVLRLVGYSPFDPLVLPTALHTDLRLPGMGPIEQIHERIDRDSSAVDDRLLGMLLDYGVAVPSAD